MKPTQEQIEKYRAEYQAEIQRINQSEGYSPILNESDLKLALEHLDDKSIEYYLDRGVPASSVANTYMYYC